jgi:hypothetical protein
MADLIKRWTLGIFAVVFLMTAGATYWRLGHANWTLASILATLGALFYAVRTYFLLKPEVARLKAEQQKQREDLFNEGCGEVAEATSHLSDADFSVFVTCLHMMGESEDSYSFMTSRGSPVHDVLVRMADVRCTRPVEMKRIRPDYDASLCRYELTKLGRVLLPRMLQDAAHRRARRANAAA